MGKRGPSGFDGLSEERKARFRRLWQDGSEIKTIAREFGGVSRGTIHSWGLACGVARGAKPVAHLAHLLAYATLRIKGEGTVTKAQAARMALALQAALEEAAPAAAVRFWRDMTEEERDGVVARALDTFAPDWIENAGSQRRERAEVEAEEAIGGEIALLMLDDLREGGRSAERVLAAFTLSREDVEGAATETQIGDPTFRTFEQHRTRWLARRKGDTSE